MAETENREEKQFQVLSFYGMGSWDGEQGRLEYKIEKMNSTSDNLGYVVWL